MSLLRPFVNRKLAEEIELDRKADTTGERLFRISLYILAGFGLTNLAARVWRWFIEDDTPPAKATATPLEMGFGILIGVCCFYVINYMVYRHVQSKLVKRVWWTLMAFIALVVMNAVARGLRQG